MLSSIRQTLSSRFIHNIGWLGGAELANRVFRLATTVVLARTFSPQDYGLVAIVMTTYEFANVLTVKSGISSKLVQASDKDLDVLCETAYWMSWIASGLVFILQCLAAVPIAWFFNNTQIIAPICISAIVYLIIPLFTVQLSMIDRASRLNIIALCNVAQSFISNLLTVILALLGWGFWAVVIARILSIPACAIICRTNYPWRPKSSFALHRWREIARYAAHIISVDLLEKLRDNFDYLLVGRFLGVDALGLYYFAFNAGLGISLNVINSVIWSLWSHLCAARTNLSELKQRYFKGLKTIAVLIIPVALLQSSLAPLYVPLVFGTKWVSAIPILSIICLSAIPRPFFLAASQLLNAVDKTHLTLWGSLSFTAIYIASLLIAVQHGIFAVAIAVLASQFLITPFFAVWATKHVLKSA